MPKFGIRRIRVSTNWPSANRAGSPTLAAKVQAGAGMIRSRSRLEPRSAAAIRLLGIGLGIFFIAMSYNKLAWLGDPEELTGRFQRWLPTASPYARAYLQVVAIPGGEAFARIVPVAEFLVGVSLLTGVYTNVAALGALFMILNFHVATSSFSSIEFLRDGTGPPLIAALLALGIAGGRLPFSLRGKQAMKARHDDLDAVPGPARVPMLHASHAHDGGDADQGLVVAPRDQRSRR